MMKLYLLHLFLTVETRYTVNHCIRKCSSKFDANLAKYSVIHICRTCSIFISMIRLVIDFASDTLIEETSVYL